MSARLRLHALSLALLLALALPSPARPRPILHADRVPPADVFSASEPAEIRTTHLTLDFTVDFDAQKIRGSATHEVRNLSGTNRFVLDTRDLVIERVTIDGEPANWTLEDENRNGQALVIGIDPATRVVEVEYETSITEFGIVFLTAKQTLADTDPFLYTLSQPDGARNWIPIQDTPGIRMTYEATVRVPPGLMALMSARNPTEASPDGVYHFEMPYPIAPYLIALAVGRLEFRSLGERTGVYVEPPFADDAEAELSVLEDMVDTAERLFGPYPFERWDILVAPPGFTAGGMENPMLNFLNVMSTVTGDDGDDPQPTYLLAHELAHTWAGDLTTCATWDDTWLNEGFATYFGHRILGEMMGPEQSEIGFFFERDAFETYAENARPEQTIMHRERVAGEPLAIFSPTSYSKGGLFLEMLERRLGRETFDELVLRWFGRHQYRWVDDEAFVAELRRTPGLDADELRIDEWIYGTGLPSNVTAPTRSALWDRIAVQADRFKRGTPAASLDTSGWGDQEVDLFLWQITTHIRARMAELDAKFDLSSMKSPSVHWLINVAATFYQPGMPMLERYLMLGGFNVISIYAELAKTNAGMSYARAFYENARSHYTPGIRGSVESILKLTNLVLRDAA